MRLKLFTAGPVHVPQRIQKELGKPILYHRDPEFLAIFHEVVTGIQYLLQTKNEILIFTASGTGGMEAVIVNLFSKGDRVLIIEQGKFSARWVELCICFGLFVEKIELSWQESVTVDHIKNVLKNSSNIKAVLLTHCETSTGALNDVESIAKAIHKDSKALIVVDAISTAGVIPFKMDKWGIDVVITSSNKGLMNPPGLVFIALNSRTWKFIEQSDLPKYYFSFLKAKNSYITGLGSPFTPAISLIYGVHQGISDIKQKGLEDLWNHHHNIAHAFRTAIRTMGLEILPNQPSDSLTVIKIPPPLEANRISTLLKEKFNLVISKGQGNLNNRVIRIGHLGEVKSEDLVEVISALETILSQMGFNIQIGNGAKAFYNCLY